MLIYLDDLGYGDPGCYNPQSKIAAPNIDRLAKECATIASVLKDAGYNTAQIGKWGIRHDYSDAVRPGKKPGTMDAYDFPNKRLLGSQLVGFDYSWCTTYLCPKPDQRTVDPYTKHLFENGLPVDPGLSHFSDPYEWLPGCAGKVVEYLEAFSGEREYEAFGIDRSKPFFIYFDPPSPHEPIIPNKEFVGKSGAGKYGDFVAKIDHYVGKILETLDHLDLAKNTRVVFSSDNGPEHTCYTRAKKYTRIDHSTK